MNNFVTLQTLVARLRDGGNSPALIAVRSDCVETFYFTAVADEAERLASGLLETGLEHGEPVGLYADGGPEWIIAFLAIVAAGAVAVPFDVSLKGAALTDPVRDSGCRRFFVTSQRAEALRACGAADDAMLYLLDGGTGGAEPGLIRWRDLAATKTIPLPAVAAGDQAALFYTSGTTGIPKGVPLTHANLVANINSLVAEHLVGPGDRVLLPLPPHHVYPLVVGTLAPLAAGAGVVFPAGTSGPEILDALHRGDASVMIGVPRLYAGLVDAIDARVREQGRATKAAIRILFALLDWMPDGLRRAIGRVVFRPVRKAFGPRLRLLASGGARLDNEIWHALERFGWTVLTGYGLTETAPILTFNPWGRSKIGSAGRALSTVEMRIADPDRDGNGEVQARGPNVFEAYRNRPQETTAAFTADGWFRTGDLGHLDDEGYLYIVGRAKELIVLSDGKNVFPETVEKIYETSPLIQEIAVLEQDGNLVGLVVPDLDGLRGRGAESAVQLVRDEIRDLSPLLAPHQRLSGHVLTRTRLPRTAIGKLRRHQLPELYRTAQMGTIVSASEFTADDKAFLAQTPAKELWDWLTRRFPDHSLSLDVSPQLDLGIDSLGWTGLSLEIEDRFGVSLTDDRIARIMTLRDLISEVVETSATSSTAPDQSSRNASDLAAPGFLQRLVNSMLYGGFWLVMRLFFRLQVVGRENVPPVGPFIIAPNHASWLDPIAVAASLSYSQMRQTRFAGWTGLLFDNFVSRAVSWAARVFPVDPDRAAASSIALARTALNQGDILIWFPEGRRTTTGTLQSFQPGIGALIQNSGIPVVPTYISGSFDAAPTGRILPRLTRLKVRFGKPKTADMLVKSGVGNMTAQHISDALHDAVQAMEDCASGSTGCT